MRKWNVSILITLMIFALAGIIVIQYLWIDKTISEKQKLINNNVQSAVTILQEQLEDYRALAFISNQNLERNFIFKSSRTEDSLVLNNENGNQKIEVQILQEFRTSTDSLNDTVNYQFDSTFADFNQRIPTLETDQYEEIESLFEKIKIEISGDQNDPRLDSVKIQALLEKEIELTKIGKINYWGIYDNQLKKYQIAPTQKLDFDYKFDLFTSNILDPGRYQLRIDLQKQGSIYKEIWGMIALSVVFTCIIILVFIYSVRLVLKHKKISQIKSDFINNMTHEFKTPLASISLAADTLLHPKSEINSENTVKYIEFIKNEKSKLNKHIERILEVAALQKNKIEFQNKKLVLADLIVSVLSELDFIINQTDSKVTLDIDPSVTILGDELHVKNVLRNLIENAIKYSKDSPIITISLVSKDKHTLLSIRDEGIGIKTEHLKFVFDDFYRGESGNIHNTKGFGLGLAYSKQIINKMGGSIFIESKHNKGTTVNIKFKKT